MSLRYIFCTLRQGQFPSYSWPMSEERVQYKFMIPVALKERLERAAAFSRRSLSSEIIERLENTIEADDRHKPWSMLLHEKRLLEIRAEMALDELRRIERRIEETPDAEDEPPPPVPDDDSTPG